MNAYTHDFGAQYDFQKNSFARPNDDARPTFYLEKVWNKKTETMDEVEMVKVNQPNERLNVWGGKVTEEHKQRWPRHYEAFKRKEVMPESGTPLARWPEVSGNLDFLDQMKGLGLWTVEEMANMTDTAAQKFHGGPTWRQRARIYLEQQAKLQSAAVTQTVVDTSNEVSALKAQVAALMEKLGEQAPKKRGPKPKIKAPEGEQAA